MKKKVLILSASEGHASLAEAIKGVVEESFLVREVKLINDFGFYQFFYRFLPSTFKWVWELGNRKVARELIELYVDERHADKIRQEIKRYSPDLVVTTYFLYQYELNRLRQENDFRWINIVHDPVSILPMEVARDADYNFGFGREMVEVGLKEGIERQKLVEVGWLVREEFYKDLTLRERNQILVRWGLETNKRTMVVCGGSEGTNVILKILPDLMDERVGQQFQIIFVAGSNRLLKRTVEKLEVFMKKTNKLVPKIKVFGFTTKMPDILRVADVVVGKAGPNLLFESVAAKKPFVAITHIEGQESGNLDLIRKYKLGWVTEKRKEFKSWLKEVLDNPSLLSQWDDYLAKMARRNWQGLQKTKTIIEELLNE